MPVLYRSVGRSPGGWWPERFGVNIRLARFKPLCAVLAGADGQQSPASGDMRRGRQEPVERSRDIDARAEMWDRPHPCGHLPTLSGRKSRRIRGVHSRLFSVRAEIRTATGAGTCPG
ncbi:hypothetical protein FRAAL6449 [Frankia alni ACN14a]|uniref:Uncharacterized protein n=1 Tax=Frankia alni (strain DSM 45986 / CECT 9034 / ACN14a) TaxID=326424 RepID=Q0RBV8_FRAAA|nr:hypothetical protein FRAAL6449 [Frankia alni ACN14a]